MTTTDHLSDLQARIIASEWHSGRSSGLYALTSSGAILTSPDPLYELQCIARQSTTAEDEIAALVDYIQTHGPRGPVAGWANLRW
jgi:hypothetical protein